MKRKVLYTMALFLCELISIGLYSQTADVNIGNSWVHPKANKYIGINFINSSLGSLTNNGIMWVIKDFENNGSVDFDTSLPLDSGETRFVGVTVQNISGLGVTRFNKVLFDNLLTSGAFKLQQNITVAGRVDFTRGVVSATQTTHETMENMLIMENGSSWVNASDDSYVDGFVRKTGNTAFTFPIGNGGYYRPASISAPSLVSDQFVARYLYVNPDVAGYDRNKKDNTIKTVSNKEYWVVNRTNGTSNVSLTLGWNTAQISAAVPSDIKKVRIVRWNGTKWVNEGNASTSGNASEGTVTAKVTSYGVFAIGSVNDLPVAVSDTISVYGTYINGSVATNDTLSVEGGNVWAIQTNPLHGTVHLNTDGTYTYTVNAGYLGQDSFTYTLTDVDGDVSVATVIINVIQESSAFHIPDGLSPNGDGYNDTFVIPHESNQKVDLKVFNRWGVLVYQNDDYQNDWDGTGNAKFLGKQLLNGTYYYLIELTNNNTGVVKKYSGYLTLRR